MNTSVLLGSWNSNTPNEIKNTAPTPESKRTGSIGPSTGVGFLVETFLWNKRIGVHRNVKHVTTHT